MCSDYAITSHELFYDDSPPSADSRRTVVIYN